MVGDDLASRTLQGEDCFPESTDDEQVLQSESRARVERLGPLDLEAAVAQFRVGRHRLLGQLADSQADLRENVSWASKPISTFSMIQSRLMETWVHGWDLRHPLGIPTSFDDRAWWLTDIGVRHVPYSLAKAGIVAGPGEAHRQPGRPGRWFLDPHLRGVGGDPAVERAGLPGPPGPGPCW